MARPKITTTKKSKPKIKSTRKEVKENDAGKSILHVTHTYEISDEAVFKFATLDVPVKEVQLLLGLSPQAFNKKYKEVYAHGVATKNLSLRQELFRQAHEEKNDKVLLFLARTVLKMSETKILEISDGREKIKDSDSDDLISLIKNELGTFEEEK